MPSIRLTRLGWVCAAGALWGCDALGGDGASQHCAPVRLGENPVLAVFAKPFAGEFRAANYFDHDLPYLFQDTNGFLLTFCGTRRTGTDGHMGYDWLLPDGTPVFAAASGVVTEAAALDFFCPPQGRVTANPFVEIRHSAPGGVVLFSRYFHLSRIDVQRGDSVSEGDGIGLSGDVGCSGGAHLHFDVLRAVDGRRVFVDPYGWQSSAADPWAEHPDGIESVWLWQPGEAPELDP